MSVKVLTVGAAAGSIRDLFAKITAIDAKHGKFDFVLCVGDFFGSLEDSNGQDEINQLLDGEIEAPAECYIMQGENPLPDSVIQRFAKTGGELCKNVFLMTKSGLLTTTHGLRIACLGGIYDRKVYETSDSAPGFASPFFSKHSVERLLSNTLATSSANQNFKSLANIISNSSSSQLVDILIASNWPTLISQFSASPALQGGAPPLDDLIKRIKPRYHFVGGGQPPVFWEREPFVWDDEDGRVTRFLSLGPFGGPATPGKKQRWFYAFSIAPNSPTPRPANATKNPFTEAAPLPQKRTFEETSANSFIFGDVQHPVKRMRHVESGPPGKPPPGYKCRRCDATDHFINDCPQRDIPPETYVCRICNVAGHYVRDCPTRHAVGDTGGKKPKEGYVCRACGSELHYLEDCPIAGQRRTEPERRGGKRGGPPRELDPHECWFCLSNPNISKHLIVAIGTECYLTLPKGQIIPTQSYADHVDIPGGGHVLIVPIPHFPTYASIPSDLGPAVSEETQKFKTALRAFHAKHGSATVFFEVGRMGGGISGHAHIHCVPIPRNLESKVEEGFVSIGSSRGVSFEANAETALASCADGKGGYFSVELPDGRQLVHLIQFGAPFNIRFGREVLVHLLNMPNRADWKACMLSEDEDRADAQAFKTAFAPFDPSV